jgi:hypothetical protein
VTQLGEPFGAAHVLVSPPADVAAGFRDAVHVAEALEGRGARVVRVIPCLEELADAHLEVKGELGVDLPLHGTLQNRHRSSRLNRPSVGTSAPLVEHLRDGGGEARPLRELHLEPGPSLSR